MILADKKVLGREYIVEYDSNASWSDWGFRKETERDTVIFLGRLVIICSKVFTRGVTRNMQAFGVVVLALVAAVWGLYCLDCINSMGEVAFW